MVLSGILFIIIIFFIILITMKVKVEVKIRLGNKQNEISVQIKTLFNLIKVKRKFAYTDIQKAEHESSDNHRQTPTLDTNGNLRTKVIEVFEDIKPFIQIILSFFRKITVMKLNWQTMIGGGNAATSAVATGIIWSCKGVVSAFINSHFKMKNSADINVVADFNNYIIATELDCMISVRAGETIKVAWKLYRTWKQLNKAYLIQHEMANRRTGNERTSN